MKVLTPEQKTTYENMRRTALSELEALDQEIAAELSKIKKRLLELQQDKKAVKQILDGASARLGMSIPPALAEISLSDLGRGVDTDVTVKGPRAVS